MGKVTGLRELSNEDFTMFSYDNGMNLVATEIDGDPWFSAKFVADSLEYSTTQKLTKILDANEKMKVNAPPLTLNAKYPVNQILINESGIYHAIFGSHMKRAKEFRSWVTSEVIPSIRKHGGYVANQENMDSDEFLAKAVLYANNVIEEKNQIIASKQKKIEEDAPKVDFYENVVENSEGRTSLRDAIKSFGIPNVGSTIGLRRLREIGVFYSTKKNANTPYQHHIDAGYFQVRPIFRGNLHVQDQTMVTPKGLKYLYKKLTEKPNRNQLRIVS